jgi:hydrogenase nickel incorporation protein HypA/HybF
MHELSVSSAVVDTVLKHAAGRRVTVVSLRIGHLRQVVPDSLAFYFELVSRETLCEGARLEQEVVPALLRCDGCALEWDPEDAWFRCTGCGSPGEVIAGNELEVESIEVEEAACTA